MNTNFVQSVILVCSIVSCVLQTFTDFKLKRIAFCTTIFAAQISVAGKKRHLGCFATQCQAALAYDEAAKHQFGQFASLNFP